jgi:hypothetical protein
MDKVVREIFMNQKIQHLHGIFPFQSNPILRPNTTHPQRGQDKNLI